MVALWRCLHFGIIRNCKGIADMIEMAPIKTQPYSCHCLRDSMTMIRNVKLPPLSCQNKLNCNTTVHKEFFVRLPETLCLGFLWKNCSQTITLQVYQQRLLSENKNKVLFCSNRVVYFICFL